MKRRMLALLLAAGMITGMLATGASAITYPTLSGNCGSSLHWVLEDGTLTITGTGAMSFYDDASKVPWYDYCDQIETVVIEDGMTEIGNHAFYNCENLVDVSIPATVTEIGMYAFGSCTALTEIIIPDSVTELNHAVFSGCTSLSDVTLSDSLTEIPSFAFNGCTSLMEIEIPDNVTEIGEYAFTGCTALTDIDIPDSVTMISDYAFWNCTALTELSLPDSLTEIGDSAFYNCTALCEITIPSNVASIGDCAFWGCTSLSRITFTGSAPSFGSYSFKYVTATAVYPVDEESWTESVMQDYGGTITWMSSAASDLGDSSTGDSGDDSLSDLESSGDNDTHSDTYTDTDTTPDTDTDTDKDTTTDRDTDTGMETTTDTGTGTDTDTDTDATTDTDIDTDADATTDTDADTSTDTDTTSDTDMDTDIDSTFDTDTDTDTDSFFFSDDTGSGTWSWADVYIYDCYDAGIINGYEDGTFRPDNNLSRAEAAKIIAITFDLESDESVSTFSDVSASHWALQYIEACVEAGIINGYEDGTFRPENNVTRAEMAKMIACALGLTSNASESSFTDVGTHWALQYIEACADAGIINGMGDGTFAPSDYITRAQSAAIISRTLDLLDDQTDNEEEYLAALMNYSTVAAALSELTSSDDYLNSSTAEQAELVLLLLTELIGESQILSDSVEYDEENAVIAFQFANGVIGSVLLEDFEEGVDGIGTEGYIYSYNSAGLAAIVTDDPVSFDIDGYPYEEEDLNALVLWDLGTSGTYLSDMEEIADDWNQAYLNTEIDSDVTLSELRDCLSGYDLVVIRTHGYSGSGYPVLLDDTVSSNILNYYVYGNSGSLNNLTIEELMTLADLKENRIELMYKSSTQTWHYVLHPEFFTYYYGNDGLADTIVWIGCCDGYSNSDLVDAIASCGADSVVASTESVNRSYGTKMSSAFVYSLLFGNTVDESLSFAKSVWGDNDKIYAQVYLNETDTDPAEFRYSPDSGEATLVTLTQEALDTLTDSAARLIYAYSVVSFTAGDPWTSMTGAMSTSNILGIPDRESEEDSDHALTLGAGGVIILSFEEEFTDIDGDDIVIYEVGEDEEAVQVLVSSDGIIWYSVGYTNGGVESLDMNGSVPEGMYFKYIKLIDQAEEISRRWPGADIDAVGVYVY